MPMIKVSYMGLEKNDVPTGIIKMRFVILCNLFRRLYGNSLGIISTWSSEGLLLITCSNYSIDM